MPSNPPLTDAELTRKFGMTPDNPDFDTARRLCLHRHDRIICQVPDCQCPHCCHEFKAEDHFLRAKVSFWCFGCGRLIYIEHLDSQDDEEFSPDRIMVTFNTDDSESTE